MKDKKSILTNQFVLIIILLVTTVVLFVATNSFVEVFKGKTDIDTCRLSVLAQAKTKPLGDSFVSLDCPRREMKFYDDKIEVDGRKSKDYSFRELENDTVNRAFADELGLCWYKMGEGKINVFEQEFAGDINDICLVCTEISFDRGVPNSLFVDLDQYLKNNKLRNSDVTYYDYLVKQQVDRYINIPGAGPVRWTQYNPFFSPGTTSLIDSEGIESGKDYVIYFLAFKPSWFDEKLTKAYTSAYYIGLSRPNKLNKACNLLIN